MNTTKWWWTRLILPTGPLSKLILKQLWLVVVSNQKWPQICPSDQLSIFVLHTMSRIWSQCISVRPVVLLDLRTSLSLRLPRHSSRSGRPRISCHGRLAESKQIKGRNAARLMAGARTIQNKICCLNTKTVNTVDTINTSGVVAQSSPPPKAEMQSFDMSRVSTNGMFFLPFQNQTAVYGGRSDVFVMNEGENWCRRDWWSREIRHGFHLQLPVNTSITFTKNYCNSQRGSNSNSKSGP